jgi:uncharacterized protein (UPF0332 family)
MALARDLLDEAKTLAKLEASRGRPRQASLRRAVSTAYYAVFHLFASEAALQACSPTPRGLHERVQRALTHETMRQATAAFSGGKLPSHVETLICTPLEGEVVEISRIFVQLQEFRHKADYDTSERFNKQMVQNLVKDAETLFDLWRQIREIDNAHVFLSSLVFWKLWSR